MCLQSSVGFRVNVATTCTRRPHTGTRAAGQGQSDCLGSSLHRGVHEDAGSRTQVSECCSRLRGDMGGSLTAWLWGHAALEVGQLPHLLCLH